jgi:putative two-component system response regulator
MEKRKIVLAIDDSPANLQLCKGLLGKDYDVRLAKSGTMALAALTRIHPDIVLLDIEMPDINGFEVMEEINKDPALAQIPVIFVTSHASGDLVTKAVGQGAVDYIVKPFSPDILHKKVKNALLAKRE